MRTRLKPIFDRLGPSDILGVLLVSLFIVIAVVAPSIWGAAAEKIDVASAMSGPSSEHLLGTDKLGRDVFARTLVATSPSILLAVLATALGAILGVGLGSLAAVVGPRTGVLLSNGINILVAFPPLLLAIFFAVIFGIGSLGSILAIGAAFTPGFARLTQTLSASLGNRDFVNESRILGKSKLFIVVRHILPNIGEPLLIYGTIHVGAAIIALAGLGFLGFGVQPPAYDWGAMLSQGLSLIYITPTIALGPAVAIALAGLSFNLMGEKLSDILADRRVPRPPRPGESDRIRTLFSDSTISDVDVDMNSNRYILDVDNLQVQYQSQYGITVPVRSVSFSVQQGEKIGIVGESGSGKSVMAKAIARLIDSPGSVYARRLLFRGADLTVEGEVKLGDTMALLFQDPGGAFNPAIRVGTQLREPAEIHLGLSKPDAKSRAIQALRSVAISEPARRYRQYQHEFSGGMKQRAAIAAGLMMEPELLIADEPTTALDVTVQNQILRLIVEVHERSQASLLLVSHDIAVVSQVSDRILVMYAGFLVEDGDTHTILTRPAHPYTSALLRASPDMETDKREPLYTIRGRVPGPKVFMEGCYFADRCPNVIDRCREQRPPLAPIESGHRVACWNPVNYATKPDGQSSDSPRANGAQP